MRTSKYKRVRRSKHTGRRIDVLDPAEWTRTVEKSIQLLIEYADLVDRGDLEWSPTLWPGRGDDADHIGWAAFLATGLTLDTTQGAKLDALEAAARLRDGRRLDLQKARWL